jgi:hypothetical protein
MSGRIVITIHPIWSIRSNAGFVVERKINCKVYFLAIEVYFRAAAIRAAKLRRSILKHAFEGKL